MMSKFSREGIHCVHLRAPFGGPAFEVICAALSGQNDMIERTHQRPRSFDLLAPSSLEKYDQFADDGPRSDRTALQRRVLGGLEPNLNMGASDTFIPPDERGSDWKFMQPKRVRELFELGSLYTHTTNRAGHAVLRRLTIDELEYEIPDGWYLRCFLHSKRFPGRVRIEDVAFDHSDFCVIDKPRSLPSVSTNDNFVENAVYQTAKVLGQKLWSVHRLDVPTSGCLILAKSGKASGMIQKQWSSAQKCYSLVVQAEDRYDKDSIEPPVPVGSTVTHWMDTSERSAPKPISVERSDSHDKECSLILESWDPLPCDPISKQARAFAKVRLLTGRTHQIRTQMAQIGWPLKDDVMYRRGFDKLECERLGIEFFDPPLSLRCYRVSFKYKNEEFCVELETFPQV